MNDLTTLEQDTITKLLAELKKDFEISSWDDFERRFLLGTGKSKNTIASYRESCKQFFDFTGGQHPWAVAAPEWIESWYDSMDGLSLNTRAIRIKGIRFMYRRMSERYPTAFEDPFNIMDDKLKAKLSRSEKDESQRDAFAATEYRAILTMLREDKSLKGKQDYAIFRFGVTSGMRSAELVNLRWKNISTIDEVFSATFTGKGSKVRTIEIEAEAVTPLRPHRGGHHVPVLPTAPVVRLHHDLAQNAGRCVELLGQDGLGSALLAP